MNFKWSTIHTLTGYKTYKIPTDAHRYGVSGLGTNADL
jgi:hypothetical protein